MATVISTEQLSRRFGDTLAVNSLNLDIAEGEVFGFLGHNGAGKTTTVRLLNGVLTPTGGQVRVFGMDPTKDGAKIRARTGVLTETPALDDRLTARATLAYFADMFNVPKPNVAARVDELLDLFDLADRAEDAQARQVVARARRMLEHRQIGRRHAGEGRAALVLNEGEKRLGIEGRLPDIGPAHLQGALEFFEGLLVLPLIRINAGEEDARIGEGGVGLDALFADHHRFHVPAHREIGLGKGLVGL